MVCPTPQVGNGALLATMRAQGPRFENCMSGPKNWKLRSAGHHAGTGGALETVCLMSGYLLYDSDTAGRRSSRKGLSACEPLLLEFAPAPIASYRCCCASTCVITSSELGLPAALASVMPMKEGCAAKAAKRAVPMDRVATPQQRRCHTIVRSSVKTPPPATANPEELAPAAKSAKLGAETFESQCTIHDVEAILWDDSSASDDTVRCGNALPGFPGFGRTWLQHEWQSKKSSDSSEPNFVGNTNSLRKSFFAGWQPAKAEVVSSMEEPPASTGSETTESLRTAAAAATLNEDDIKEELEDEDSEQGTHGADRWIKVSIGDLEQFRTEAWRTEPFWPVYRAPSLGGERVSGDAPSHVTISDLRKLLCSMVSFIDWDACCKRPWPMVTDIRYTNWVPNEFSSLNARSEIQIVATSYAFGLRVAPAVLLLKFP